MIARDSMGMRRDLVQERYNALPPLERIRALLFPTLLYRALQWCHQQDKVSIRQDILNALSRAAEIPLRNFDMQTAIQYTAEGQDLADQILHAMNADNAKEATLAVASMIARVAELKHMPADDTDSYCVLASLWILGEAGRGEGKSGWPNPSGERLSTLAQRGAERARMSGIPLL